MMSEILIAVVSGVVVAVVSRLFDSKLGRTEVIRDIELELLKELSDNASRSVFGIGDVLRDMSKGEICEETSENAVNTRNVLNINVGMYKPFIKDDDVLRSLNSLCDIESNILDMLENLTTEENVSLDLGNLVGEYEKLKDAYISFQDNLRKYIK